LKGGKKRTYLLYQKHERVHKTRTRQSNGNQRRKKWIGERKEMISLRYQKKELRGKMMSRQLLKRWGKNQEVEKGERILREC